MNWNDQHRTCEIATICTLSMHTSFQDGIAVRNYLEGTATTEATESGETYLPSRSIRNLLRNNVRSHATQQHQQGSQRPWLRLQDNIKQRVRSSCDKAPIEHYVLMVRQTSHDRQLWHQGIRVSEQNEGGEQDGPNEADVNEDVNFVSVERSIECKMLLEVENITASHDCNFQIQDDR